MILFIVSYLCLTQPYILLARKKLIVLYNKDNFTFINKLEYFHVSMFKLTWRGALEQISNRHKKNTQPTSDIRLDGCWIADAVMIATTPIIGRMMSNLKIKIQYEITINICKITISIFINFHL